MGILSDVSGASQSAFLFLPPTPPPARVEDLGLSARQPPSPPHPPRLSFTAWQLHPGGGGAGLPGQALQETHVQSRGDMVEHSGSFFFYFLLFFIFYFSIFYFFISLFFLIGFCSLCVCVCFFICSWTDLL